MITRHAQGAGVRHHIPHEPKRIDYARAAVPKVAHENRLAALRVFIEWAAPAIGIGGLCVGLVAQLRKKRFQFVAATVQIANDVEWAVVMAAVIPERLTFDGRGVDFVGRLQYENVAEAFALEAA